MENKKEIKITINELPIRAEKLSVEKVTNIFGGCLADGQPCQKGNGAGECCNSCNSTLQGSFCFTDNGAIYF